MDRFSEKNLVWQMSPFWAKQKMANRQMKIVLMIFPEKFLFGASEPFWAQKWWILIILDSL